jgi:hypothetical protein
MPASCLFGYHAVFLGDIENCLPKVQLSVSCLLPSQQD